jgi:hypothetical protein
LQEQSKLAEIKIQILYVVDASEVIDAGVVFAISIFQHQQILYVQCALIGVYWLCGVIGVAELDTTASDNIASYRIGYGYCVGSFGTHFGIARNVGSKHKLSHTDVAGVCEL